MENKNPAIEKKYSIESLKALENLTTVTNNKELEAYLLKAIKKESLQGAEKEWLDSVKIGEAIDMELTSCQAVMQSLIQKRERINGVLEYLENKISEDIRMRDRT